MNTKPSKTQLQEIYQSRHEPLPKYNTGLAKGGGYISSVTLPDFDKPILGVIQPNKRDAERTAAEAALRIIFDEENKVQHQQQQPTTMPNNSIALIEYMSADKHLIPDIKQMINVNIYITSRQKDKVSSDCGNIIMSKYDYKESINLQMIVDATRIVDEEQYNQIYIVSSNESLYMISAILKNVTVLPSVVALYELLSS